AELAEAALPVAAEHQRPAEGTLGDDDGEASEAVRGVGGGHLLRRGQGLLVRTDGVAMAAQGQVITTFGIEHEAQGPAKLRAERLRAEQGFLQCARLAEALEGGAEVTACRQ